MAVEYFSRQMRYMNLERIIWEYVQPVYQRLDKLNIKQHLLFIFLYLHIHMEPIKNSPLGGAKEKSSLPRNLNGLTGATVKIDCKHAIWTRTLRNQLLHLPKLLQKCTDSWQINVYINMFSKNLLGEIAENITHFENNATFIRLFIEGGKW